ncbi:MAG: Rieske (2Fe-2S) protein, partial [Xenococcaceae cyanobacterium]
MSWTKVLPVESLSEGTRQVVKVGAKSILLLNHSSQIYAVENSCPH